LFLSVLLEPCINLSVGTLQTQQLKNGEILYFVDSASRYNSLLMTNLTQIFISLYFMFEFPCIIRLYYIKNQQDATLAVLFISNCKITVHVSDVFCFHH
jgi:hypothetical protein